MVRTYTPATTITYESSLKARFYKHIEQAFPAHIPLRLFVTFYRVKSRYLPKKELMPFRKCDLDNLVKSITDAMNGILMPDDAQITTLVARKRWANNDNGYITLKLEEDKLQGDNDVNSNL
jgi:Holliday junction resolvase RusA-like endonuclease